jgi:hypothetical protein
VEQLVNVNVDEDCVVVKETIENANVDAEVKEIVENVPQPCKSHLNMKEESSSSFVMIQIVEARNMKVCSDVSKTHPVGFVFRRNVMYRDSKGDYLFKTLPFKKSVSPKWNERFQVNVYDAETEVITIKFASDNKANLKALKNNKTYMGEVTFRLRSAVRDFDRPNLQFKWYNITDSNGNGNMGEVKIFIEFIDTRQVSKPTDFKKVSHIGFDGEGFSISNIPPAWKKFFKDHGVSKRSLEKNPEAAGRFIELLSKTESTQDIPFQVTQESQIPSATTEKYQPPPPPIPTPVVRESQLPPPPPISAPIIMERSQMPLPPPIPAPVVKVSQIPPPIPGQSEGKSDLLDHIRRGTELRKIQVPEHIPEEAMGILDTLTKAFEKNRKAINGEDDSDSTDWSDSE